MFTTHDLLYIASVAALILAMPGPTNTLLFSSSVARGFSRSLVLVVAELVAYLLAISCWGFLLLKLLNDQAWIATTLKLGAAFYIAYLSLKIWKFEKSLTPESSITSRHVFITTLLNPKAFLFASFVMPPKVFIETAAYFPAMGTFALTMIPVSLGWCLLGHLARSGSNKLPMFSSGVMLRGASLVLCFFSASILYDVLHKAWQGA